MKHKWLAFLLIAGITVSALSACAIPAAQGAAPAAAPAQEAEAPAPAAEEAEPAAEAPAEEAVPEAAESEVVDLKVLMWHIGWADKADRIIERLNDITREKIGITITPTWMDFGNMGTAVSLAMASREHYDLVQTLIAPATFDAMFSSGQLMDATDALTEYAPDLWVVLSEFGDFMKTFSVDDKYYGVPTYYNYASNGYILMRKDLLEEYDLLDKIEATDDWNEITEIFKEIHEKSGLTLGDVVSVRTIYGSDKISESEGITTLGDSYKLIYVDGEGKGEVSSMLDYEGYRRQQDRVREWFQADLVNKDLLLDGAMTPDEMMRNDQIFGYVHHSEIGVEVAKEQATGYEIYAKTSSSIPINAVTGGFVFPVTCEEPEAAAAWLNEFYTNPDMQNLICWGEEGIDYVVNDDGLAEYPEGKGVSDVYHTNDFSYGNNYNTIPWAGPGITADFQNLRREEMRNHTLSPYFGFVMNTSELDTVIAGVSSVYNEYYRTINYGAYTDEDWEAYHSKLNAAGYEDLIQAYQDQLDAWMGK